MGALWRMIGFFINPFAALLWWLTRSSGRGIDRLFGPTAGLYFALALLVLALGSLLTASISIAPFAGRYVGIVEPPKVETVQGQITAVATIESRRLTILRAITVNYKVDGQIRSLIEQVTDPVSQQRVVGHVVRVYLPEGGKPTIRDPNDRFAGGLLIFVSLAFPLVMTFFTWRYLSHRRRLYDARPAPTPLPMQGVKLAGSDRVLSTAERLKADEERMRRLMAGKR